MHADDLNVDPAHAGDHRPGEESAAAAADTSPNTGQASNGDDRLNQSPSCRTPREGLPRPQRQSYLDDPDHALVLDPASYDADAETVLETLLRRNASLDDLELILQGAVRLFEANAGTAAECLDTSSIWLYG